MKSTLNNILRDRILLLCILDILVIFWIIWYESQIQYEPPLDYNDIILPLIPETYNAIIATIIVNIIVLIVETIRLCRQRTEKGNLKSIVAYFVFSICCMAWGYFHISSRVGIGVVNHTNLYISLCVIHIIGCIVYVSRLLSKRDASPKTSESYEDVIIDR